MFKPKSMSLGKYTVEELFWRHSGRLRSLFKRKMGLVTDVQDLVQEVYLRILRVPDGALIRNPEAYLFTVAHNLVKERAVLKRREAQTFSETDLEEVDVPADLPAASEVVGNRHSVERLHEVLEQLTPKCRAVVVLRYQEGLSYLQIAERLQLSESMVKKYLSQALIHCRKRMASWS